YSLFDGGPFGEFYHAHYDFGCIELYAFNRRLVLDPGRYTYTLDEMSRYLLSSYSHNVVLIDNKPQGKINPSSASWAAGFLGSCARAAHTYYGAKLERELLFTNFRNAIIDNANLSNPSNSNDTGRYWIVSDFWAGSGAHDVMVLWQMPKYEPIYIDNASQPISMTEMEEHIRCVKTNYSSGNLGVYGFGPWKEFDNITAGESSVWGQPYGWYSPTMYVLEEGTTLRYIGEANGPSSWFTVLYPSINSPNITITTPPFKLGGATYISGGIGNAPGNVIYVEHENGAELHISLAEPTPENQEIELNVNGYKINFKGRQISIHFNSTNQISQIFTQYLQELSINDVIMLKFSSNILTISQDNDLAAFTFGLEPSNALQTIYIGSKVVPPQNYVIENNAINLGALILRGDF
ncbi:MAG: heparinase II/III domain-containing protein, partial [Candidatus Helarchaeota archaeon]